MRAAWLIAVKDIKLRLRDKSVFIVGLLAPFGLAFIFDMIIGPVADQEFKPAFAVVDEDGGQVAQGLVGVFRSLAGEDLIELRDVATREEAAAAVENLDDVDAAVIVPAGFSAAVQADRPAQVELIGNPDASTAAQVAKSILDGFSSEIATIQRSVEAVLATATVPPTPAEIGALGQEAASQPRQVTVGEVEAVERQLSLPTFFVAGMGAMFLFFTVQFAVISLLEERKEGTMSRLAAAPIAPLAVVGGKAIVGFLLGVGSMTVLVVASTFLMGAEWGNPLGVALLIVSAVVAATGLMGLVAAFSKTVEQAGNLQSMFAIGLAMIGGIFFPGALGTGILSKVAYISPHRWWLIGLNDLAGGGGLGVIVPSILALLGFGVVTGGLALLKLRKGVTT
jgi:ABC-2 type transport system permease protein